MNVAFNNNEDIHRLQLADLKKRLLKIYKGGGESRLQKQHDAGKLSARERIEYQTSKSSNFSIRPKISIL